MAHASTGLPGLDSHLGGGVPRGTTILLVGDPDNAVPAFCQQFAGAGVNNGEQILYFEMDRPAASLRKAIAAHAINMTAARAATLKVYDGYAPQFGQSIPTAQKAEFAAPLSRAEMFPALFREAQNAEQDKYRIVVESLSAVVTERNEAEVLDFVKSFVFLGHQSGGLHLLTLIRGMHSDRFEAQIKHQVGGVIELGIERKGFGLYPYLFVQKMLGVSDPVKVFPYKETEKGISLETAKRL